MARFTEEFHKTVRNFTDAPDVFIKAGALFLLSTAVGRHVMIVGPRPQYLNLWFLQVGDSRVSRKTTVLYWCKQVLNAYMPPQIPPKSPAGTKPISPILIPSGFSPEAFFSILCENPQRAWIKDEMSGFIKSFSKRYMSDMPELLSKVYDCTTESRRTKTGGHEVAEDPYLTIFSASTPILARYFNEDLFYQGLGNRFIYVMDFAKRDLRPFEFFGDPNIHRRYVTVIVNHLKQVRSLVTTNAPNEGKWIGPQHQPAKDLLERFENAVNKRIYELRDSDRMDMDIGYTAALPEFVRQLAALFSIDRYYEDRSEWARQELDILPEAVEEAINYAMGFVDSYQRFKDLIKMTPEQKSLEAEDNIKNMVYRIVKDHDPIKTRDLSRRSGKNWHKLKLIVDTLIIEERIFMYSRRPQGRGAIATMYTVSQELATKMNEKFTKGQTT